MAAGGVEYDEASEDGARTRESTLKTRYTHMNAGAQAHKYVNVCNIYIYTYKYLYVYINIYIYVNTYADNIQI